MAITLIRVIKRDLNILLKSIELNHNHIFKYIFPWTIFLISINDDQITFKNRCKYLKLCKLYLERFPQFYDNNLLIDTKGTIISLSKIFNIEKGEYSLNRLSSNPLEHTFGILRMKARNHDTIQKFISDIKRLNFIRLHRRDFTETVIRHRVSDFGKTIHFDGTFYNADLNSLLDSIEKFILFNQKDSLFENFIQELRDLSKKAPKKNTDTACSIKEITLNPSSTNRIRDRQEMDHTGRKYCPWTKSEEEKLLHLNDVIGGDIKALMKFFPDRSPESLRQKIKKIKVK